MHACMVGAWPRAWPPSWPPVRSGAAGSNAKTRVITLLRSATGRRRPALALLQVTLFHR
ncbi:hypothetical protein SORBI_3007G206250 [Sorghum bicolor]|uniref:Uncharacterized protein n=1 Tax=Sorghum bicolor TaxID=4558 RepID=A0A1Z5RAW8_SORBI|nr:hypothetical protein SORBI_3007G206250 [Sorghum bicolor]